MDTGDKKFRALASQAEAVARAEKKQRDAVQMQQIDTRICKDVGSRQFMQPMPVQ